MSCIKNAATCLFIFFTFAPTANARNPQTVIPQEGQASIILLDMLTPEIVALYAMNRDPRLSQELEQTEVQKLTSQCFENLGAYSEFGQVCADGFNAKETQCLKDLTDTSFHSQELAGPKSILRNFLGQLEFITFTKDPKYKDRSGIVFEQNDPGIDRSKANRAGMLLTLENPCDVNLAELTDRLLKLNRWEELLSQAKLTNSQAERQKENFWIPDSYSSVFKLLSPDNMDRCADQTQELTKSLEDRSLSQKFHSVFEGFRESEFPYAQSLFEMRDKYHRGEFRKYLDAHPNEKREIEKQLWDEYLRWQQGSYPTSADFFLRAAISIDINLEPYQRDVLSNIEKQAAQRQYSQVANYTHAILYLDPKRQSNSREAQRVTEDLLRVMQSMIEIGEDNEEAIPLYESAKRDVMGAIRVAAIYGFELSVSAQKDLVQIARSKEEPLRVKSLAVDALKTLKSQNRIDPRVLPELDKL